MDQYTIYIVVSFICIALACCFCRDDDDDGIDIRFRDDAIIIDEESQENEEIIDNEEHQENHRTLKI